MSNNLIKIDFTNDKIPEFVEPKSTSKIKYVKYGENNDYPQFLTVLFNRSAKHNAICTDKQLYITGKGWYFDSDGMEDKDKVLLQSFIDSPNPYESLKDLLNKTALDELMYGGCYLKGVNGKNGKLSEVYHVDYNTVRSNDDNTEFYISNHWLTIDGQENKNLKPDQYETISAYDPDKKQKSFIFYYKSYRPGLKTYTLPEYIGAIPAIITDAEIANFHRAEIQNGFKGSKMIIFKNGVPGDDEMKKTERQLKAKFTNTDSAGSMVIDFVDDPNRTPEILDLAGGDFDKKYDALNKTIQEEIFVGHKVTSPMLFGVRVEGQLGGRNEMIDAFNLFQNKYVTPKQEIQERIYNFFAPVKGRLKIKPIEPITATFSEATLEKILTQDEMREITGRQPLEPSKQTVYDMTQVSQHPAFQKMDKPKQDDELDFSIFSKYGEPIDKFESVKVRKFMMSKQEFLSKIEQGVLDLVKKTPDITEADLMDILQSDKTTIQAALETLVADGLINIQKGIIAPTAKGEKKEVPTFDELFIRYRYVLRPDAPALKNKSRPFCEAMVSNPRYFSKEDIENISSELGQLYNIPDYDAFKMRGGWYHDPVKNVNLPYCRHVWQQELVKRR